MNVAIVGCGKIAAAHVTALRLIDDVEVIAVCDRDPDHARDIARAAGGADVFVDLASLLRRAPPDAIHVLTPPDSHAALAIEAMEAGCHALVEKPMALSVGEASSMIEAARENGVKLCANHNYLFKPSITKARRLLGSGAIGEPVYIDSYYGLSAEGSSYAGSAGHGHWAWRLPGGVFTNFLPHLIYLQLAFLGPVESVGGVTLGYADGTRRTATEMSVLLRGPHASGIMSVSMRAKPYAKFVDIYGTKGTIHADLVREVCTVHRSETMPRMVSKVVYNLEDIVQLAVGTAANAARVGLGRMPSMPGLCELVREFYGCIRGNYDPPVSAEGGKKVAEVLEMVWADLQRQSAASIATTSADRHIGPVTEAEHAVAKRGLPGKVLVTGATGFLGHHLVEALSRSGATVVALVRDENRASLELERWAELVRGDVRESASLDAAMQDISVVYHCAAITTNRSPWAVHHATNVLGAENVFKAALKAEVARVIHVSSVIVYGLDAPRSSGPIDESAPYAQSKDVWAHYLKSKLEADKTAMRYWREERLPITVLRPGILYGPGRGESVGRGLVRLGGLYLTIGRARNRMPYTFISNAVDCLLLAAISPDAIGEVFNIVDEPQISIRDSLLQIEAVSGERWRFLGVPSFMLSSVAALLERRARHSESGLPPRLSRFVVRSASRDILYDTQKARQVLGWRQSVTLEEGLQRTFRGNGVI